MKRNISRGFTLVELMVVIGILGLLVGILAVAVIPKLMGAKKDLEIKQMGDIKTAFDSLAMDKSKTRKLTSAAMKDSSGRGFYNLAFKHKLLDADIVGKIVSLVGGDTKAESTVTELDSGVELEDNNCSYTAPKATELLSLMNAKGKNRKVMICFNSRNWANYDDAGVLCQWTDEGTALYITKLEAKEQFQIDSDTWDTNPKDIIGNKAPFDKTFE